MGLGQGTMAVSYTHLDVYKRQPLGTFALRDPAGKDLIFLATGTGIAPVKALLESLPLLKASQAPASVTLLWGGRYPEDLYLDFSKMPVIDRYIPCLLYTSRCV